MNKTKVRISGECQKLMQKDAKGGNVMSVAEVLVVIQYSTGCQNGYTRSVVI